MPKKSYKRRRGLISIPAAARMLALVAFLVLSGEYSPAIADEGRTFAPGLSRIGRALLNAATSPLTWVPGIGSAAVYYSGSDRSISNWAGSRTPVFGSQKQAGLWSNYLLNAAQWSGYTAMTTQVIMHGLASGEYWQPAGVTLLSAGIGVGATGLATEYIKHESSRLRPDETDRLSFPSGHASYSTACATVAACNIELIPIGAVGRIAWQAGGYTLAAGAGWARVEARKHYLSDVLAGAMLGHFLSHFACEVFLGTGGGETPRVDLQLNPVPGHVIVQAGLTLPMEF